MTLNSCQWHYITLLCHYMPLCYISRILFPAGFFVRRWTQKTFTCSRPTTETLEKAVKYVQWYALCLYQVWTYFTTFSRFCCCCCCYCCCWLWKGKCLLGTVYTETTLKNEDICHKQNIYFAEIESTYFNYFNVLTEGRNNDINELVIYSFNDIDLFLQGSFI